MLNALVHDIGCDLKNANRFFFCATWIEDDTDRSVDATCQDQLFDQHHFYLIHEAGIFTAATGNSDTQRKFFNSGIGVPVEGLVEPGTPEEKGCSSSIGAGIRD